MIKFEKTNIWGFEHAIRGVRNPLNSWDKSDSRYDDKDYYIIGDNDLGLCKRLIKGGPEHRKFLRQIMVSVDITAPLYWWKEFDTYKVGTVANSCSTMHTIHKKEFTLEDFSCEHLLTPNYITSRIDMDDDPGLAAINVNGEKCYYSPKAFLGMTCDVLNRYRKLYLDTKDKNYWKQMIQLLPSSYNQKRTITMNYENLRSIYFQRKEHKLDEWREGFINWIQTLPYCRELIIFDPNNTDVPESLGEKILNALN